MQGEGEAPRRAERQTPRAFATCSHSAVAQSHVRHMGKDAAPALNSSTSFW